MIVWPRLFGSAARKTRPAITGLAFHLEHAGHRRPGRALAAVAGQLGMAEEQMGETARADLVRPAAHQRPVQRRHLVEPRHDRLDQRRKLVVGRQFARPARRRQHDRPPAAPADCRTPRTAAPAAGRPRQGSPPRSSDPAPAATDTRRRRRNSRQTIHSTITATAAGSDIAQARARDAVRATPSVCREEIRMSSLRETHERLH